jgi:hypothetical protein
MRAKLMLRGVCWAICGFERREGIGEGQSRLDGRVENQWGVRNTEWELWDL